jgi:hypothetical protein
MEAQKELPDELVKVVMSSCPKCEGVVRIAIEHLFNKKDFYKEVVKYNLSVRTISLLEFRSKETVWCECKKNNGTV